ncbi:hypothetical protein TNCT_441071 [Trichonephila clavata]|uniref:Uncharacterized protein n=1 Tax=Trichonephila clavata TaxID=2740835 RepID=A0A8X6GU62_TRICU|nr:hypothetical protein TNCT_441071 [Trichonephila clavata]
MATLKRERNNSRSTVANRTAIDRTEAEDFPRITSERLPEASSPHFRGEVPGKRSPPSCFEISASHMERSHLSIYYFCSAFSFYSSDAIRPTKGLGMRGTQNMQKKSCGPTRGSGFESTPVT